MSEDLVQGIADLREEEVLKILDERLSADDDPSKILEDCRKGLEIVGKRFASGEYFLPDLIYSGEILRNITEIVKPKLKKTTDARRADKIVVGTVAGDIHDIGKNIVVFLLDVNGFDVYDLGVDVPAQKFVEKIKETQAKIVGLSGLLTLCFDSMKETVDAMKSAGLRDKVKIMIGGSQVDDRVKEFTGADACGRDAMDAVSLAKKWSMGE